MQEFFFLVFTNSYSVIKYLNKYTFNINNYLNKMTKVAFEKYENENMHFWARFYKFDCRYILNVSYFVTYNIAFYTELKFENISKLFSLIKDFSNHIH